LSFSVSLFSLVAFTCFAQTQILALLKRKYLLCSNANTCFAQTQSSAREQIITEEASKATKACIAVFNSTVHGAKDKDFAHCLGDQVEKAVGNCPDQKQKRLYSLRFG
jgi:hypothetical protein